MYCSLGVTRSGSLGDLIEPSQSSLAETCRGGAEPLMLTLVESRSPPAGASCPRPESYDNAGEREEVEDELYES